MHQSQFRFVLRQAGHVSPGVCLPVCLLATSHRNYFPHFRDNFTRDVDVGVDKEVIITFWKSFGGDLRSQIVLVGLW